MDLNKIYYMMEYPDDWKSHWEVHKIREAIKNLDLFRNSGGPDKLYVTDEQIKAYKKAFGL